MDEIVLSEIHNLCELINTIFIGTVSSEIEKLRTETCSGREADHPSQTRYECI